GDGWIAFAEYVVPGESRQFSTGGLLIGVYYDYCAQYSRSVPNTVRKDLELCGIRAVFHADLGAKLPEEIQRADIKLARGANYQRVLQALFDEYGQPPDYQHKGHIIIEPESGERIESPEHERFEHLLWCGAPRFRELYAPCPVNIAFTYDPETRW